MTTPTHINPAETNDERVLREHQARLETLLEGKPDPNRPQTRNRSTKPHTRLQDLREVVSRLPARSDEKAAGEAVSDEVRIYEERVAGFSSREVATRFSIAPEAVDAICERYAENSRSRIAAEMAIATIMEIDRLNVLQAALWDTAKSGDFGAIDRVLNISKERRKLLGIDAPEVKASLNLTANANEVDLSGLSLDELRAWESIQVKLKGKTQKGKAPLLGGAGSRNTQVIVDAEIIAEPEPGPSKTKKPKRPPPSSSGAPAGPQP